MTLYTKIKVSEIIFLALIKAKLVQKKQYDGYVTVCTLDSTDFSELKLWITYLPSKIEIYSSEFIVQLEDQLENITVLDVSDSCEKQLLNLVKIAKYIDKTFGKDNFAIFNHDFP